MLARLRSAITPPPAGGLAEAQRHLDSLTKPPGSLGRLEEIAARLAALAGGGARVAAPLIPTLPPPPPAVAPAGGAAPPSVAAPMGENIPPAGPHEVSP